MRLYFKHSENNKPAAQITINHFNFECSVFPTYEIHCTFKDAMLLIEAAEEQYLKVSLQLTSELQDGNTYCRLKITLRGVIRMNP